MKTSIIIKKLVANFLLKSGFIDYRIRQYKKKNYFLILMYHRIIPRNRLMQDGMFVSPETFECHLDFLNKKFNVVPIKDLLKNKNIKRCSNKKPICALTFDDGWKDFYKYAYPILLKHKFPATVFLPTAYIGTEKKFWTDTFAYLLNNRNRYKKVSKFSKEYSKIIDYINNLKGDWNEQLEDGIGFLKNYNLLKIQSSMEILAKIWNVDIQLIGRDFLNWLEISEIKDSGLVSLGSHTDEHHVLTTLKEITIKKELMKSRKELLKRELLDESFIPFSYPNGNYTKEIAEMVSSSGYHLAVTTRSGWNPANADRFTLKRVGIHEDMTSTIALFASRISCLL